MQKKVLICLYENDVAPRFDLTTEVFIAAVGPENRIEEEKSVVLPRASAEELCHMILTSDIQTVICGGIEEEYYQYLIWKRINVFDAVIGTCDRVLEDFIKGTLRSGAILYDSPS
jgi:predicted Fe-Mo cluster-binding NifX family protein